MIDEVLSSAAECCENCRGRQRVQYGEVAKGLCIMQRGRCRFMEIAMPHEAVVGGRARGNDVGTQRPKVGIQHQPKGRWKTGSPSVLPMAVT